MIKNIFATFGVVFLTLLGLVALFLRFLKWPYKDGTVGGHLENVFFDSLEEAFSEPKKDTETTTQAAPMVVPSDYSMFLKDRNITYPEWKRRRGTPL